MSKTRNSRPVREPVRQLTTPIRRSHTFRINTLILLRTETARTSPASRGRSGFARPLTGNPSRVEQSTCRGRGRAWRLSPRDCCDRAQEWGGAAVPADGGRSSQVRQCRVAAGKDSLAAMAWSRACHHDPRAEGQSRGPRAMGTPRF
jgi:hypothetical protein